MEKAEKLAKHILEQLDGVLCSKLKELKVDLQELRSHFKVIKGKDRIAGCKTWEEFCKKKLHRTDRAVRKMLAGPKPKAEPKAKAEQSSAKLSEADAATIAKGQAIAKAAAYLGNFKGEEFKVKLNEFVQELTAMLLGKAA